MLSYEFMRHAFAAAALAALAAAACGYFLVLRGQSFAGHALSHIGFAGAAAAPLFGLPVLAGFLLAALAGGAGIGLLGEARGGRDVAIGMVLALALGLGMFFLHLYHGAATLLSALLFGNVFAVDRDMLGALALLTVCVLGGMALLARPLLFVSLQPELAEAKGVAPRRFGVLFLLVTAAATALASVIVGSLLVFTLLIGPAAAALRLSSRVMSGLFLTFAFALGEAWGGLALAYATDWPVSVAITFLAFLVFLASELCTGLGWRRLARQ